MKNSSKYLLAAVLVLLTSLTAYNMALRAEYKKGNFKDPLYNYTALPFSGFTEVSVPAATAVGVKIMAGPYRVRISPRAAKYVHVSQQGSRLVVEANFPGNWDFLGEGLVIECPRLAMLATDAVYQRNGQRVADKSNQYFAAKVSGFQQDSLFVQADRGSKIMLSDNRLGFLRAVAGRTPGSHSGVLLGAGNQIAAANLTLSHQSELELNNIFIPQLHHHMSDSVKVTLTGAALGSLAR